ncbi:MAG TPA: tetratricopeptide repeat protein [Thermoplasmata archaeon]|nr:tetratricopeptide repeat protein [Thermoplasmata archaeon]
MSTPEPASPPSAAPPGAPLEEVRTLYRAAVDAQSGNDRELEVALLKAFLAGVETRTKELVPSGEEVGPLLDDTAMQFNQLGQPALALRAIDRGLSFQPGAVPLLHHKSLILLGQNKDLPEVLALVGAALQAAPNDRALWATRGDALKLLGRSADAAEAYLRAQQLDASSTQYVDKALRLVPTDPKALRMKLDLAEALGGDLSGLEAAEELLKVSPDDTGLRLARARLLASVGRPADALAAVEPLRGGLPENDAANLLAIRLHFEVGTPDDGTASAKQLIERAAPPDATTLGELARLLEAPAPELALGARQRLAEVDPRNLQNLHALRALAARLDRVDVALAACVAVLATQPDNLDALGGVAELQVSQGKTEAALDSYRAIVKAQPQALVEHRKGLDLARSLGNDAAVREFAQAILSEDSTDNAAQLELARSYAAGGETTNALTAYDALLAAHPGQLPYLLEKKTLLASSSDPSQLAPVLDELFRLDPTRTDLAIERGNLYLALAYDHAEGSAERDHTARTALVSYERASTDPEAASVADLGIARASRLIADPARAIRGYQAFLARDENATRNDVRKELGHALREMGRYAEAIEVYSRALTTGLDDPDLLWGAVEVLDHMNQDARALQFIDLLLLRDASNPAYLRKEGQLLLRVGRHADALRILQRAIDNAHGDPHAYFEVAEALRSQGAYADAIAYFRRGLEVDPTNRHGRIAMAEALVLAGQYSEVVQITDPLLKENPNDVAAWKARADAWRALGRPSEVLYSLKAILLLEPDDPATLLEMFRLDRDRGEWKEAFDALSRLLASSAPESQDATLHLERGDLAAKLGDPEAANGSYGRAAEIDPALKGEIAVRRARLRLAAGRPDLALEVLDDGEKEAPSGTPPSVNLLLLRAQILVALERPTEARSVYEGVRTRDPTSPVAVAGIARTMLDQGQHAGAAEFLSSSIPKVPPNEDLYLLLIEAESGSGHLERAAEVAQQGVAALPGSATLWARAGEVAIARQNWPEGASAYQHALAVEPTALEALLRAGFVAEKLGHPNEALAFYERAVDADPKNLSAWTSRGLTLIATARPQEAVASFERALALDSDYAPAKDGKKLAVEKTRDQQVQRYGREALLLEARLNRPVAKNDLFVTLHVPFEFLEPVLQAIGHPAKVDLDRLTAVEVHDLETQSQHLITSALERRPPGIEHRGFSLSDVAVLSPPTFSLDQIQRIFGYLRAVLEADLRPENLVLEPDVEELARKALVMPEEQRTLFQLVRTLRVGIYKARLIKAVEQSGAAVHAPVPALDLGAYSPEFRTESHGPGPGAAEVAEEDSERFFAPETAPALSPGAPAPDAPVPAAPTGPTRAPRTFAPTGSSRCIGCGGVSSVLHSCGAPLCQHCIGQFPKCPKCGQPVSPLTVRPVDGVLVHSSTPSRTAPARTGGATAALKGVFQRSKPAAPKPAAHPASTPAPAQPPKPAADRPRVAAPTPPTGALPKRPAPTPAAKPATTPPPEPPAPPPLAPRPRRERTDDEPRL